MTNEEQQDDMNLPEDEFDQDPNSDDLSSGMSGDLDSEISEELQSEIDQMSMSGDVGGIEVQPAQFSDLDANNDGDTVHESRNVQMLLDVELNVVVELGRKTMMVSDVLNLGKGSVVELPKAAGEPLDILINGTRLARGEVVVIDEHFAVRITELAAQRERIKSLG